MLAETTATTTVRFKPRPESSGKNFRLTSQLPGQALLRRFYNSRGSVRSIAASVIFAGAVEEPCHQFQGQNSLRYFAVENAIQ